MRTKKERLAQAGLMELGGIVIVAPCASLATGHDLSQMGALALMLSTVAVLWSTVWNWLFDRWVPTRERTLAQRLAQTLGFEFFLAMITVFIVAWWMNMGLLAALWLDLGFIGFFLIWALAFNHLFDKAVVRLLRHREGSYASAHGE
ncbi:MULTISPECIES: PACE efflux transporter [Larsenimonas]|uniref:PACE efflux transporter n=1 Tax=Larsenimonas suaedae TaxID=1851019 RepID=A0ABU1GTK8_9GAMM|nr:MULTISPECIES: PACE efflux transporter [Larsenimonas]MCM2972471.1 PACE efflux transporter [Larsenimonas suaedae]MCM5704444.1 PACE efflux transporter [Larsenimonas salina]MDR5894733.1 PACE efflux transporter [Larsenimonas suaedae]